MSKSTVAALRLLLFAAVCLALIGVPATDRPAADADSSAPRERSVALSSLYVSFAALQVLDVESTMRALRAGGREANPFVDSFVESPAMFAAMKAVTTAGVLLATERLRKHKPKTALFVMIGLNSAYATIAAHNYGIAAEARGR
jgi:uncharacterized protein DUF5658